MKHVCILIGIFFCSMMSSAQTISAVIDSVTTTAAYKDEYISDIRYHIRISSDSMSQVCDTFGHTSWENTWGFCRHGKARIYSSVFGFVFCGDTIWADRTKDFGLEKYCYSLLDDGASVVIMMDKSYLSYFYYSHSDLWPSLNHFGRYFVEHADLFLYINGEYYMASKPQDLQIKYLSNDFYRIES